MPRKLIFSIFLIFIILPYLAFSNSEIKPFSGKSYIIPFTQNPPKVDGVLTKSEWQNALIINKMYQIEPGDNVPPTDKTIFYLSYDSKNLYVGIRAYIKNVDKFQAIHISRDGEANTEFVQLIFDTFAQHRQGYSIMFNPYGEIRDGIFTGHHTDTSQDFEII